jgi:hypothetical protein
MALGEQLHVQAAQRVPDQDVGRLHALVLEIAAQFFDDGQAVARRAGVVAVAVAGAVVGKHRRLRRDTFNHLLPLVDRGARAVFKDHRDRSRRIFQRHTFDLVAIDQRGDGQRGHGRCGSHQAQHENSVTHYDIPLFNVQAFLHFLQCAAMGMR